METDSASGERESLRATVEATYEDALIAANTALRDSLLALEREFWDASSRGEGDFYRHNVTDDGVFVFPAPTGTIDRETCASVVDGNDAPWEWYRIEDVHLVELCAEAAVVSYRAEAKPDGSNPFSMLVGSAYARRAGRWLLAFHQQTILKAS